jgi:hypothetical protein
MCQRKKLIFYTSCLLLFLGAIIAGIVLATQTSEDIHDHSHDGVIINTNCRNTCGTWCYWTILFTIAYNQNNISYIGTYTNYGSFVGCDTPISVSSCCENLIDQTVWLDPDIDNPNIIDKMTVTKEYNTGLHTGIAILLFFIGFIILCFVIYMKYTENRVGYIQFF